MHARYLTNKVETYTSIATILGLRNELMVLKLLRYQSDRVQSLLDTRNRHFTEPPNVVKLINNQIKDFDNKMNTVISIIENTLHEKFDNTHADAWIERIKQCPNYQDDDFLSNLHQMSNILKTALSQPIDITELHQ